MQRISLWAAGTMRFASKRYLGERLRSNSESPINRYGLKSDMIQTVSSYLIECRQMKCNIVFRSPFVETIRYTFASPVFQIDRIPSVGFLSTIA
jgi:hypothetical protein